MQTVTQKIYEEGYNTGFAEGFVEGFEQSFEETFTQRFGENSGMNKEQFKIILVADMVRRRVITAEIAAAILKITPDEAKQLVE